MPESNVINNLITATMNTPTIRISPPIRHFIRKLSSTAKWRRNRIDDYTCEWNFPRRTLLGVGRRYDVIEELRLKHGAVSPLVVTDYNIQNLPIIQVKRLPYLFVMIILPLLYIIYIYI